MRLLCITLGIGILIWKLQAPPEMIWVGFLLTASTVGARLAHRAKLPDILGMIAAGLAIGFAPITTAENHQSIKPFADIAMAWIGLYLGTSLSRPIIANQRLIKGSLYLYTAPVLTTFFILILFDLHLVTTLQLAILSGISSPIFLDRAEHNLRDTWPFSLYVTAIGLCLLFLTGLIFGVEFILNDGFNSFLDLAADIALAVLIGVIGIELMHRWLRHIHTPTGQFTSWFALSFLLALASWHVWIQPLILAWTVGLVLSLRTKRGLRPNMRPPKAEALVAFALAHYVSGLVLDWQMSPVPSHFFPLIAALILGKIAGGLLASRFTLQPIKTWLPLLPQGLLAIVCFESIAFEIAPLYFVCTGICLPILHLLADQIVQKIKNGRIRALARRTQAV